MADELWDFDFERGLQGPVPFLDSGLPEVWEGVLGVLAVVYRGDGPTVVNVTDVEVISTSCSQKNFSRPIRVS